MAVYSDTLRVWVYLPFILRRQFYRCARTKPSYARDATTAMKSGGVARIRPLRPQRLLRRSCRKPLWLSPCCCPRGPRKLGGGAASGAFAQCPRRRTVGELAARNQPRLASFAAPNCQPARRGVVPARTGIGPSAARLGLLGLAGLAAWRANRTVQAIGYWKNAQAIQPDAAVAALLAKAEREAAADQGTQALESTRFSLRFETLVMSTDVARGLSGVLEQELSRISLDLGCQTAERLSATAQSREAYLKATGAAEWSGGQFDGRIRVAVIEDGGAGAETRKRFAHELVHACLAGTGRWPAWLHEGLAQRLSGEILTPEARAEVRAAAINGTLPRLNQMNQNWSLLSADHARLAYSSALYAVELFYLHHKEFGIRTLIRNPEFLDRIANDLDQRIRN